MANVDQRYATTPKLVHTKLLSYTREKMMKKFWEGKNGEGGATIAITLILWRPACLPIASWNPYT